MAFSFLPVAVAEQITDLTAEMLQNRGIQLLMMDFDNTIVPYTTNVPTREFCQWLDRMSAGDIRLCVVSNSRKDRVKQFCRQHGLDCITHARKPFSKGIRECLKKYGLPPAQCALVGDQIFTDTLGGNFCGVQTILVRAIHNHNFWLKARHVLEMPFIFVARHRKI